VERYELNRACLDSDCGGAAEPEEELAEGGMLCYWRCTQCEMEFGYELVPDESAAGSCSLGIPEGVRRKASTPVPDSPAHVFLGTTIGRRPQ
jgi:hypothetical protein